MLVEVISTRLPLGVRAEADEAELEKYLKRTVTESWSSWTGSSMTFIDSESAARLPGIDMSGVERVWAVLVKYGDLLAAGPLLAYIAEKATGLFGQSFTRPLTLLGLEDVEVLAGMLANGEMLADVLAEKNGGAYRGAAVFALAHRHTSGRYRQRLHGLEQRWSDMTDGFAALLRE